MDTSSRYRCLKTAVFTENRNVWKHEDIEHVIATIYGLFVFSSHFQVINNVYEQCSAN